jgi:hypothetical protein
MEQLNKKQVVHVNRLKHNYNPVNWKTKQKQRTRRKQLGELILCPEEQEDKVKIGRFPPTAVPEYLYRNVLDQTLNTPHPCSKLWTPLIQARKLWLPLIQNIVTQVMYLPPLLSQGKSYSLLENDRQ